MRAHETVHVQRGYGGCPLYHTSLYLSGGIGADDVGADDQDDQGHEHEPLEQRDLPGRCGKRYRCAPEPAQGSLNWPAAVRPRAGCGVALRCTLVHPTGEPPSAIVPCLLGRRYSSKRVPTLL